MRQPALFSVLPLLLFIGCCSLPATHSFPDQRELRNIFAHGMSFPNLAAESRQGLDPIRNREEVNATDSPNPAKTATSDGDTDTDTNEDGTGTADTDDDSEKDDPLAPMQSSESLETTDTASISENGNSTLDPFTSSLNMSTSEAFAMNDSALPTMEPISPTQGTNAQENTMVIALVNSSFIVSTAEAAWNQQLDALSGAPGEAIDGLTTAFSRLAAVVVEKANARNLTKPDLDTDIDPEDSSTATINGSITDDSNYTQEIAIARVGSNSRRHLRGSPILRQLLVVALNETVEYDVTSAVLIGMRPGAECPDAPSGNVCLVTFAQYALAVNASEDSQVVYDIFVQETQAAIADGTLQQNLQAVDEDSIFTVEGASEPVEMPPLDIPDEGIEPVATDDNDDSNNQDGNDREQAEEDNTSDGGLDGLMLGLVIAISITAFMVCVLLAVFVYLKFSKPPSMGEKDTNANEQDDNDAGDLENRSVAPPIENPQKDPDESINDCGSPSPSSSHLDESGSVLPSVAQKREYRRRVAELVQEHCPEESKNIDQMLQQFQGREVALIAMLENMDEVERELEKEQGRISDGYSDDDWSDELETAAQGQPYSTGEETKEEVQEVRPGGDNGLRSIS